MIRSSSIGFGTLSLALLVLTAGGAPAFADTVRLLLVTGESDLPYHSWRETAPFLKQALERTGRFEVRVLEEPRGLSAAALAGYGAVVVDYNGPRWGSTAERALEDWLRAGHGLVTFHLDSYAFADLEKGAKGWVQSTNPAIFWPEWQKLVGGFWTAPGLTRAHSPRRDIVIDTKDAAHPVMAGMASSFVISDELYNGVTVPPSSHVIADAFDDVKQRGTGERHPMAWVAAYGKGRIFHTTLGHDTGSMYAHGFAALFARGAEWAATGAVTLPPQASMIPRRKGALRLLVVTGGHTYPSSFYTLFEADWIDWRHAASQREAFSKPLIDRFDVILLHDMAEDLEPPLRTNLRAFLEAGKGLVSTHHSIVDYTGWEWFWREATGGKYFTKPLDGHAASSFKEGLPMTVRPTRPHRFTQGVGTIVTVDEAYRGMWLAPGVTPLMETDMPENDKPVVYLGPNPKLRTVYIQLGHGEETLRHPSYRRLIHNALHWAAGR